MTCLSEARLPRSRPASAADDRRSGCRVVRRAKGRDRDERMLDAEDARDRVDPCHLERRGLVELGQEPGKPARQHRLPSARRAAQEQVVTPGRRDLERASSAFLAVDVSEIRYGRRGCAVSGWDRLGLQLASKVGDRFGQVPHGHRLDPGERGLRCRLGSADDSRQTRPLRALGDRKDARDRADTSVEGELAVDSVPLELGARDLAGRGEHCERDRQVEARTLLAQRGRREVDRDPAFRPLALRRADTAADALLRLLARAVGETDDRECGQRALEMGLDLDATSFKADESMCDCAREHAATLGSRPRGFVSDVCQLRADLRAISTSSKYSPARRPVRRFT
jgi:hypothetical protein